MISRLDGPLAKVDRAKEHIGQLRLVAVSFFETNPYRVETKENQDTGETEWVLRTTTSMPLHIGLIAGDAVHNLRSALDLLAWQLVLDGGGVPTPNTSFPVFTGSESFSLKRIEGATEEAKELVTAARPYRGGNDALWQLHKLDIIDKHRLLVAVGAAHRNVIVPFTTLGMIEVTRRAFKSTNVRFDHADIPIEPEHRSFPLKDGDVLFTAGSGHDAAPKFTFEIAINEPCVVEGESLIPLLTQYVDQVEGLIEAFRPILRS